MYVKLQGWWCLLSFQGQIIPAWGWTAVLDANIQGTTLLAMWQCARQWCRCGTPCFYLWWYCQYCKHGFLTGKHGLLSDVNGVPTDNEVYQPLILGHLESPKSPKVSTQKSDFGQPVTTKAIVLARNAGTSGGSRSSKSCGLVPFRTLGRIIVWKFAYYTYSIYIYIYMYIHIHIYREREMQRNQKKIEESIVRIF